MPNSKREAVKASLTSRLQKREAQWLAKHGTISAQQCEKWTQEAETKRLLQASVRLNQERRQHSRAI